MKSSIWIPVAFSAAVIQGCGGGNASGPIGLAERPLLVTDIPATSLMYAPLADRIIAIDGNTVRLVNPANGRITGTITLQANVPAKQISTDGASLYSGGGTTLLQYNLSTGNLERTIDVWPGITGAESQAVGFSSVWPVPGQPGQIIVERNFMAGVPEPQVSLAKFTNGVLGQVYNFPSLGFGASAGCFNGSGSLFFAIVTNDLVAYNSSLAEQISPVSLGNYGEPLSQITDANGKLLYGPNLYSEQTLAKLGQFGSANQAWASTGVPGKDEAFGFCQGTATAGAFMAHVDLDTIAITQQWPLTNLPNPTGYVGSMQSAGTNRVAMLVQDKSDTNMKLAIFTAISKTP